MLQIKIVLIQFEYMGNDQQAPQQSRMLPANINHHRFKNAKIITEGQQQLIQTTFGVGQEQYQNWKNTARGYQLDTTALLLPKKQQFQVQGLCGTTGTLKLYFQNFPYLLLDEIRNRKERKSKFEETDLWYLLLVLCSAQQEMKRKCSLKVGDIRPHNIFLNASGDVKVSCVLSWPKQDTSYHKALDNQQTYLSPEDLVKLETGTLEDKHSYKSEMFSIGLTLLSAAMLQDFLALYTIRANSCKFNTEKATLLKNQWRSNTAYSQILTAIVSNLCEFRVQKRLDDDQLWQWISQFHSEIKNRQDFFIEWAPAKIQAEIQQIRKQFITQVQPTQQIQQSVHQLSFPQHQPEHKQPQNYQRNSLHPSFYEVINPKYVESYHEPIPKHQISPVQKSPSNQKITKNQLLPPIRSELRHKYSEIKAGDFGPQFKQLGQVKGLPQRSTQISPFKEYSNTILQYKQPAYLQNKHTQPQKTVIFTQPSHIRSNSITNKQPQLLPQLIAKPQGYIQQYQSPSREQVFASNGSTNEGGNADHGLSYFQNVIDPSGAKGGRIEQTVYIKRPDYISSYARK